MKRRHKWKFMDEVANMMQIDAEDIMIRKVREVKTREQHYVVRRERLGI